MTFSRFLFGTLLLAPMLAIGQAPPYPPCAGLPGCGTASNTIVEGVLPVALTLMLRIAAGGAVLAVVWGGFQMVTNAGNDDKVRQGKFTVIYALGGLALAIFSQALVSFVVTENFGQGNVADFLVGGVLASLVRMLLNLTNVALAIVVVYEGIRMVMAQGKQDEFGKAVNTLKWAVIGAIVINSARVLVTSITSFFGV